MNNTTPYQAFESKVFANLNSQTGQLYEPIKVRIAQWKATQAIDAVIEIGWLHKSLYFDSEIISRTSPQLIESKVLQLKKYNSSNQKLIIVPYLSASSIEIIKENDISGLDLNGNYYLVTPSLLAIRLDQKNQYKESTTIRKIYSGTSSLVCRYLLSASNLEKGVGGLTTEINQKGAEITIPTVSKVIKRLEEELVVSRSKKGLKVIQKDKLLKSLKDNYIAPKISEIRRIRLPEDPMAFLKKFAGKNKKWSLSGVSSANQYTLATVPQAFEVYTEKIPTEWLQWEDERFFNCILKCTQSEFIYFDRNLQDGIFYSSKLQTYIELANGDKREKETGEPLRQELLG